MQIFRNMDQPETGDIRQHPGYAQLPEAERKAVDNKYAEVFSGSQRLGLAIAHGMAYQTAKQMCESYMDESKGAFKRLQHKLEGQGHSEESAGAIAAAIGNKKYGKKAMQKGARTGHPVSEDEVTECGDACDEDEVLEGFGDTIKKVASKVNDVINPRRRKAIKIMKRVMGEGEESSNPEDDEGAAGIQHHNKEMKYCDACDGVHAKDEKCAGCMAPANKPEDPKDHSTVPGGAGEIQKTNHKAKGMKEAEKGGDTYGAGDTDSADGGDSGGSVSEDIIAVAARYISREVDRAGGVLPMTSLSTGLIEGQGFDDIGPGDHVTFNHPLRGSDKVPQQGKGKVVMRSSHGGWVLNMGGKHGTPGLVDRDNYVSHRKAKK